MKIVVYTHSDVDWVWEPWLKQTNKYFSTVPKVVFLDEGASFDKEYTAVTYDDTIPYNQRVTGCLEQMDDEDIILFNHEDIVKSVLQNPIIDEVCPYGDGKSSQRIAKVLE